MNKIVIHLHDGREVEYVLKEGVAAVSVSVPDKPELGDPAQLHIQTEAGVERYLLEEIRMFEVTT